jgi:hypothetical protein
MLIRTTPGGLRKGAPCTVYATEETWRCLDRFPLTNRLTVAPREPFRIHNITLEAFCLGAATRSFICTSGHPRDDRAESTVEHSLPAPAVGYRIQACRCAIFYVPGLVRNHEPALSGIRTYVGDGASLRGPIIRKKNGSLVGHAAIRTQPGWCRQSGVQLAFFTHCGTQIVGADPQASSRAVRDLGLEQGIDARIAHDGLNLVLP